MSIKTADLCDDHIDDLQVAEPLLKHYGGKRAFHGEMVTLTVFDDNVLVRKTLEQPGNGRVLVIDGSASVRCALLGDLLAALAAGNGWSGVVINGCIRDSGDIAGIELGVMAINTVPRKSAKNGDGREGGNLRFAGVSFRPGNYLYADGDGIVLAERAVHSA